MSTTPVKYIFVTGGVVSSLGKGIVSASLAKLLQARGYSVTIQKFDPYINVDPGTLNPYEHGEVYVTEDGAETDLDLGHYERYLNIPTSRANNVTTGRIYQAVIEKERKGLYHGKTVQVIPHITDEIKHRMRLLGQSENPKYEIIITEIGGTVGDIESLPYIEAVRQMRNESGPNDTLIIHLALIPYLGSTGELKTKPAQHSVKELQSAGIQPDILVCRTEHKLGKDLKAKLALFCNLQPNAVIESADAPSIYDVPLLLRREQMDRVVLSKLKLPLRRDPDLESWNNFLQRLKNPTDEVQIALVGKYAELPDAYKSINEALVHAGAANEVRVRIHMIHSEDINESNVERILQNKNGLLVAPGFGERGIQGKINAIAYARRNGIPFFGICLGMQMAVVEFGRNVLGLQDCNSTEFNAQAAHPVIDKMESQKSITQLGGTMRLGVYNCNIFSGTLAHKSYKKGRIAERHRHRYEFNNDYKDQYEAAGMTFSGVNPETGLVEILELPTHPYFIASQFHPEYRSTPENPHPLFISFVRAMVRHKNNEVGNPAAVNEVMAD